MNSSNQAEKASISPIRVKPDMRIKFLSDQDVEKIHQATMDVLEKTGVRFPSEKALKTFADAGADVDFEKQIVKIPPDLLMKTIARAPRSYTMGSTRGRTEMDVLLNGNQTYLANAGTGMATIDIDTRLRRESVKQDVADMAKIADYLPFCSFYWPMVSAHDVPTPMMPIHEVDAGFSNTEKHVHIISSVKEGPSRYIAEMAKVIAGSDEIRKERPPVSVLICPVSPLNQDSDSLEAGLVYAKAGLPVGVATMPTLGATSPASVPGTFVQGNAEILSTISYIQLVYPGAPCYYSFFSVTMNPITGGSMSSSRMQHQLHAGISQIGHFYNLPVMCGFGSGDSREPGTWRHGKESSVDALFVLQTCPDMIPNMGLNELYTLLYHESIILENEVINSVKAMAEGVIVDDYSLAVDEINSVGPGGHYLSSRYTMENMRKLWKPDIAHQWAADLNDFKDPREMALEKARWILKNHKPIPLEDRKRAEIDKIIKAAEKELI
ncbi:MAG: trimethylamine methyltransferase family protein [Desulfobacterales bacterium]|nr:trimethylamine methyltransferase family protein [Desulfobacterales bacterium]